MEMVTLHTPEADSAESDVTAANIGVLFSVEDYTADLTEAEVEIIDTFF
jgi:hypothetical protein